MKKIILFLALALFGCAGSIVGMEPKETILPKEMAKKEAMQRNIDIEPFITTIVEQSSDNAKEAIEKIESGSDLLFCNKQIHKIIMEDLPAFTLLMHKLSDKYKKLKGTGKFYDFNDDLKYSMIDEPLFLAMVFQAPIAKKYVELYKALETAAHYNDFEKVKNLIAQGVDIRAQKGLLAILNWHRVGQPRADMTELLLQYGADPNSETGDHRTVLELVLDYLKHTRSDPSYADLEKVKTLLENAIAKEKQLK